MKDLYETLGVSRDANQSHIRSAYKARARERHPDKAGGSTEAFQELNQAYSILRDPVKRAKYDNGESLDVKPKINEIAEARLAEMFQQAVVNADNSKDIIEIIRDEVCAKALSMQRDIDQLNSTITKYEHVLDRVEYHGDGNDIFTGQVNLSIESIKHQISGINDEIEVVKVILGDLNDYEFKVEEKKHDSYLTGAKGSVYAGFGSGWGA